MFGMIEIGTKRTVISKTVQKDASGKRKLVPKIGPDGEPETKLVANETVRVTRGVLSGHFCRDGGRKLVVKLCDGDVLKLWPRGTRQAKTATLFDIYSWMIRSAADKVKMAKLREIKQQKEDRRAERRLRRPLAIR